MQSPGLRAHELAPSHQDENDEKGGGKNGGLDTETVLWALRLGPADLEVGDDESAQGTGEVHPGSDLARAIGVAVKKIGVDGDGGDHHAEDIEAPGHGGDHVMVGILEAEADKDKTCDHEGGGDDGSAKADFWLEVTMMAANVLFGEDVVKPVANQFAETGSHNGSEVEVADLKGAEVVERVDKDRESGVNANNPGECEYAFMSWSATIITNLLYRSHGWDIDERETSNGP